MQLLLGALISMSFVIHGTYTHDSQFLSQLIVHRLKLTFLFSKPKRIYAVPPGFASGPIDNTGGLAYVPSLQMYIGNQGYGFNWFLHTITPNNLVGNYSTNFHYTPETSDSYASAGRNASLPVYSPFFVLGLVNGGVGFDSFTFFGLNVQGMEFVFDPSGVLVCNN